MLLSPFGVFGGLEGVVGDFDAVDFDFPEAGLVLFPSLCLSDVKVLVVGQDALAYSSDYIVEADHVTCLLPMPGGVLVKPLYRSAHFTDGL